MLTIGQQGALNHLWKKIMYHGQMWHFQLKRTAGSVQPQLKKWYPHPLASNCPLLNGITFGKRPGLAILVLGNMYFPSSLEFDINQKRSNKGTLVGTRSAWGTGIWYALKHQILFVVQTDRMASHSKLGLTLWIRVARACLSSSVLQLTQ